MYFLGIDIGSSSVKVSLLEAATGKTVASAFSPAQEMKISSPKPGWAEQDPEMWWLELKNALNKLSATDDKLTAENLKLIASIGISYQMHGLVLVDKNQKVLRPAIIWCDSRAVEIGKKAFKELGEKYCINHYYNSPGNFTASKAAWVKQNEPDIFEQTDKILLPGDYIAMRLTGEARTTVSGLSEGIFWDFKSKTVAKKLLEHYSISENLLADRVPTFGFQGAVTKDIAEELGLKEGTPVTYRVGDQPNNAFSLNVLNPGEVAVTAGTSGVVYAVTEKIKPDKKSRVNTFVHVNNSYEPLAMSNERLRIKKSKIENRKSKIRNGILLCVNGTGILNSWLRKNSGNLSYEAMNELAAEVAIGSEGLIFLPFGNGAERILENKQIGASMHGLNLLIHHQGHQFRAAQEGIVFALKYGMEILETMVNENPKSKIVRAGNANMFLSPVFCEAFANTNNAVVELYNTDGAAGAARGAGLGIGYFKNEKEAFVGLEKIKTIEPEPEKQLQYQAAYEKWKNILKKEM